MKQKIICILAITMFIITTLQVSGNNHDSSESTNFDIVKRNYKPFSANLLVRINATGENLNIPRHIEILGENPGKWVDIIIPQYMLHELANKNIDYSILIRDIDSYSKFFANQYHTLAEMDQMLNNILHNYPNITNLYSIGKTYEGRDIWCLEISDNPGVDEKEPGVFYMGLHHAREWPTLEICLYLAENLTSNYGIDPEITDLVNNQRLWIVPCVNPDGYYYCHDQIIPHDWRKNRHYFPEFGTWGVDLNRNYGGSSNGDAWGSWGTLGPSSVTHNPNYETYCGPSPMSENETQAIRNIFLNNDISATITWHTHGELVLWPWSYSKNEIAPDNEYMSYVGKQIASRITKMSGSETYTPKQGSYLYPTTGDTTEWAYGYGHYVQGRPTFAYTIEACSSFHPSENYLEQVCKENYDGAIYLLKEAKNISNVIPRVIPPEINDIYNDLDGNFTLSWAEKNPDANPNYFQIDELTNLSLITDDAESGSDLWILDGFTIVNSKYNSASNSFKSRERNKDVSSMTTVFPTPVKKGMTLSFWCWFDIEDNWDYAFVEISKDGRYYQLLDKFTGLSDGWTFNNYDLTDYDGESVFIRFRYSTDDNNAREGFYVDDISTIADFGSIVTLSKTSDNNYYDIINRAEGDYYYRVRGFNFAHGWGDFSTFKKIHVGYVENEAPNTPTIDGLTNGKAGESYKYTYLSHDPNEDNVYLCIEWGDGESSGWIGPYASSEKVEVNHTFIDKGMYTIRAKAKDIYGAESEWGTLEINMPKNKRFNTYSLILELLDELTHRFPLLKLILY